MRHQLTARFTLVVTVVLVAAGLPWALLAGAALWLPPRTTPGVTTP